MSASYTLNMSFLRTLKKVFIRAIISLYIDVLLAKLAILNPWFVRFVPHPSRYLKYESRQVVRGRVIFKLHPNNKSEWLVFVGQDECGVEHILKHLPERSADKEIIVFDIGANVGQFSTAASKLLVTDDLKHIIHAFEPNPEAHQRFLDNLKVNPDVSNCIKINRLGLGESSESVTIEVPDRNLGAGSLVEDYSGEPGSTYEVKVVTLDSYVESNNIASIDFMKIDVECYEPYVLKGATQSIEKFMPVIYIEVVQACVKRTGLAEDFIHQFLWGKGYELYQEGTDGQLALLQVSDELFKRPHYNILAINKR